MKKIKKFPSPIFWRNFRLLAFAAALGAGVHFFIISPYLKAFIPESVSIYIVYLALAAIVLIALLFLSLRQLKPYRSLQYQLEELPLDVPEYKKLKAIYQDHDFSNLTRALVTHQETLQTRVNSVDGENNKLASSISSFPFPLITLNSEKEITFSNAKARELFPKLENTNDAKETLPQDILLKVNETLLQKKLTTLPYKKINVLNNNLVFKVESSPVYSKETGDINGVLLIFLANDNDLAIKRISDDLLKGISLHLISPLRRLEEESLPESTKALVEDAKMNAESFHELFDMAENNWEKLQPFDLKEHLNNLFELFKSRYPNKTLTVNESQLKLTKLLVYPELFQTALKNIISNCFKYGRDHIAINVKSFIDEDDLYIYISDNGKGIEQDKLDGIFEFFYRQALLGQPAPDGKLSLGLSIIKSAIYHHKGQVSIHSRENCGTTIKIKLPYSCKA